jgi:hypothetical protein
LDLKDDSNVVEECEPNLSLKFNENGITGLSEREKEILLSKRF